MPRGRPTKSATTTAAGPAKAVAKEETIYQKILFNNMEDRGENHRFTYFNEHYNLVEGVEMWLKKEVVDWLNSLMLPQAVAKRNERGATIGTDMRKISRFMLQVLETRVGKPPKEEDDGTEPVQL